ncbi:highly divergent homeobox [Gastrophryne carolinensis]
MNLRSVFTAEQQRILQRYYDSGMTNQSKGCFQLILQCAQETKLDFSVVRTWVGNKRRKMSSKTYEPSAMLKSPIPGPQSRPSEGPAARSTPPQPRPQAPRVTSVNDLIMTCVYSPNGFSPKLGPQGDPKPVMPRAPLKNEGEYLKLQAPPPPTPSQRPPAAPAKVAVDDKAVLLPRQPGLVNPPNSLYIRKGFERTAPQRAWPIKADLPASQRPLRSEHAPAHHRSRDSASYSSSSAALKNLEIKEVFSLATADPASRTAADERARPAESFCFSIAMETGDIDEYTREEELAAMAAQNQTRVTKCGGSPKMESPIGGTWTGNAKPLQVAGGNRDGPLEQAPYYKNEYIMSPKGSAHNANAGQYSAGGAAQNSAHRHYTAYASQQGALLPNQNNYQISGNLSVPWITECSRKRTLQDRTQFSDLDLAALKKYWDNGMTSLGSVCRDKIEAVATQLSVDCEIVRTWIGNRRRKYRLMGIEVPPPRGGPATFPDHQDSPASALTPKEDPVATAMEESDRHDNVSICLSEDSLQADDMVDERSDEVIVKEDGPGSAALHSVKMEAPKDELADTGSNMDAEQLHAVLDYKNEELRYVEAALEEYKQKYAELQSYTRSLLHAIHSKDVDQQRMLASEAPPELEDMEYGHASPEDNASESNNPDIIDPAHPPTPTTPFARPARPPLVDSRNWTD